MTSAFKISAQTIILEPYLISKLRLRYALPVDKKQSQEKYILQISKSVPLFVAVNLAQISWSIYAEWICEECVNRFRWSWGLSAHLSFAESHELVCISLLRFLYEFDYERNNMSSNSDSYDNDIIIFSLFKTSVVLALPHCRIIRMRGLLSRHIR